MRRIGIAAAIAAVILILGASALARTDDPKPFAGSAVKVETGTCHGSGVHLGAGFILTAAHVTTSMETVTIRTDDGGKMKGEVLWTNAGFDVSMIYVPGFKGVAASELSCSMPSVGDEITIIGNPGGTEFAKTWGRVSALGKTGLEAVRGKTWRKLVTLDITAAPGVSGGPVYNARGDVIGLLVAGQITMRGAFPYAYMVAGPTLCHVLGRVA